jgi:hypothetical protein
MGDATAVVAYKGFNRDFTCRGFQYRVGETYEHDGEVAVCESGFHACEHPLDVFRYYAPATSRFAAVTLSGELSRDSDDSKVAASLIMIEEELSLHELIERAIKHVFNRAEPCQRAETNEDSHAAFATGDYGAATASGPCSAASATGHCGVACTTGIRGAASVAGDYGAAAATGDYGAASATGYGGAASATGDYGAALATSIDGAASTTGEGGAAIATGYYGAASASGHGGAAIATGRNGRASGEVGCALFLVERAEAGKIIHVWAGIVGRDGIKPNTFYTLRDGRPVEVED